MIEEERDKSFGAEVEVSLNDIQPVLAKKDSKMQVDQESLEQLQPRSQELYEIDLYYDAQMSL